jgi:hypothetical protein|tara:strand:- start:95 stop:292 length:198 start_codon:yes stop_codon:yes gene_type:complete
VNSVLFPVHPFSRRRQAVNLVEEDYARLAPFRFFEQKAQTPLGFAHVLPKRVRAFAREKVHGVRA